MQELTESSEATAERLSSLSAQLEEKDRYVDERKTYETHGITVLCSAVKELDTTKSQLAEEIQNLKTELASKVVQTL